jgi:hypothetical protein
VRTNALGTSQAEAVLLGFERSLSPALMELELEAQDFRHANACLRAWRLSCSAPGEAPAAIRHSAAECGRHPNVPWLGPFRLSRRSSGPPLAL